MQTRRDIYLLIDKNILYKNILQSYENQDFRITVGNHHSISANNENLRSKPKIHLFLELAPDG